MENKITESSDTPQNFELRILKPYLKNKEKRFGAVTICLCDDSQFRITDEDNYWFQQFMIEKARVYFKNKNYEKQ